MGTEGGQTFWDTGLGKVVGAILVVLLCGLMAVALLKGCRHELGGYSRLFGLHDEAAEHAANEKAAREALPEVDGNNIPILWDARWLHPDAKKPTVFSFVGRSKGSALYFGAIVRTNDGTAQDVKWTVITKADYDAHKRRPRD